jgi:hypothetical protein
MSFDIHVPLKVAAGSTFSVRVDDMTGYPYVSDGGRNPHGVLSVTGAVAPAGEVGVGGGTPYPQTLSFTATGQPGDTIDVTAVRAGTVHGNFPDAFFVATCFATVPVATITLT